MSDASQPLQLSDAEALEILYGPRPLLAYLPRFVSRQALLEFYAAGVGRHFSTESLDQERCDICGRHARAAIYITLHWCARVRIHWGRLLLVIAFVPICAVLFLCHLWFLIIRIFKDAPLADWVYFETVHGLCEQCSRDLKIRGAFLAVIAFLLGFIGVASGIATVILGSFVVSMALRAFGFQRRDLRDMFPLFVTTLAISIACVVLGKLAGWYVGRPKALRMLVKKPFTLTGGDPRWAEQRQKAIIFSRRSK